MSIIKSVRVHFLQIRDSGIGSGTYLVPEKALVLKYTNLQKMSVVY